MQRGFLRLAFLAALLAGVPFAARAQMAQPGDIPPELSASARADLDAQRSALLQQRSVLQGQIAQQNENCSHVAADSPAVATCRANQAALIAAIRKYNADVDVFNRSLEQARAEAKRPARDCAAAEHQAEMDRKAIERQLETNEMNQEERKEWESLNGEAQKQAVIASATFVVGKYAEDLDQVRDSVAKLGEKASELAKDADQAKKAADAARKAKTMRRYLKEFNASLAQFDATIDELRPMTGKLLAKGAAEKASDAKEIWDLARNTMQYQFRVAGKTDQNIHEMLKDPEFKETFSGDAVLDKPGLDVLSILAEKATKETGDFLLKGTAYTRYTGPAVTAAVFVRDASYSALLSALSTKRVLQQNDVAGDFARSSVFLQQQYKRSVDALRACRDSSSGN